MRVELLYVFFASLLLVSGLAYLFLKTVDAGPSVDFQFIWLAGDMWLEGVDPYQKEYHERGAEMFAGQRVPDAWYYPPNWWPVASLFALLPFQESLEVWRIASALSVIASCVLLSWAATGILSKEGFLIFACMTFYACITSATAISLSLGQTSLLLCLGISLLLVSVLKKSRPLAVLALVVLMLKPQLGIPVAVFLLMDRYWWPSIFAAALATALAASAALQLSGIGGFLASYSEIIQHYEGHDAAHPANMTGLRTLIFGLFGTDTAVLTHVAIISAATALIGWRFNKNGGHRPEIVLFALIAVIAFLVPVHYYDITFVVLPVVFVMALPLAHRVLAILSLLMLLRANNLEALLGLSLEETTFDVGSWLATLSLFVLALTGASLLFLKRSDGGEARLPQGG